MLALATPANQGYLCVHLVKNQSVHVCGGAGLVNPALNLSAGVFKAWEQDLLL